MLAGTIKHISPAAFHAPILPWEYASVDALGMAVRERIGTGLTVMLLVVLLRCH